MRFYSLEGRGPAARVFLRDPSRASTCSARRRPAAMAARCAVIPEAEILLTAAREALADDFNAPVVMAAFGRGRAHREQAARRGQGHRQGRPAALAGPDRAGSAPHGRRGARHPWQRARRLPRGAARAARAAREHRHDGNRAADGGARRGPRGQGLHARRRDPRRALRARRRAPRHAGRHRLARSSKRAPRERRAEKRRARARAPDDRDRSRSRRQGPAGLRGQRRRGQAPQQRAQPAGARVRRVRRADGGGRRARARPRSPC